MPISTFRSWPIRDQIAALGLTAYDAGLCDSCGQPAWLSHSPDLQHSWEVRGPQRCFSCSRINAQATTDAEKKADPHSLRYGVDLSLALPPPRR